MRLHPEAAFPPEALAAIFAKSDRREACKKPAVLSTDAAAHPICSVLQGLEIPATLLD